MSSSVFRWSAVVALLVAGGCSAANGTARPPHAEFLLGAADSTFWVATGDGEARVRGAPLILAKVDGRFYEVYAHHDDMSYPDAILLGDRIYRRDILSGDSTVVLADTTVSRMAKAYAAAHPDARPLAPNEDGEADPSTNVTAEFDILDVFGPYVSYEYHLDVEVPGKTPWHSTRQGVLDLRSGKEQRAADLFGRGTGARLTSEARRGYAHIRDSIARARPSMSGDERRAAMAIERAEFDESSFTLLTRDGKLAVVFSVPGRGEGPAGNVVELEPLTVDSAAWWTDVANAVPTPDEAGADRWTGGGYHVVARYDTSGDVAHVSLADSTKREWPLAQVHAPLFQVLWLDRPPVRADERTALTRAFNHAASYDQGARVARGPASPEFHLVTRYASEKDRSREPTRNVRAHDARTCQQHGSCVRRRDPIHDGQMRGDRRVSAQPGQRRDGLHRPGGLSRANPSGRPGSHEGECQLRGTDLHGSGRPGGGRRAFDGPAAAYQLLLSDVRCR